MSEDINLGKTICELKCEMCGKWFTAAIQFGDSKTFFSSNLSGNLQQCTHCNKMTNCNKENMRFSERAGEGLLRTYYEGSQTLS